MIPGQDVSGRRETGQNEQSKEERNQVTTEYKTKRWAGVWSVTDTQLLQGQVNQILYPEVHSFPCLTYNPGYIQPVSTNRNMLVLTALNYFDCN